MDDANRWDRSASKYNRESRTPEEPNVEPKPIFMSLQMWIQPRRDELGDKLYCDDLEPRRGMPRRSQAPVPDTETRHATATFRPSGRRSTAARPSTSTGSATTWPSGPTGFAPQPAPLAPSGPQDVPAVAVKSQEMAVGHNPEFSKKGGGR